MTKPSTAYKSMPDVPCPTCGHIQPKVSRQPITASFQVHWNKGGYNGLPGMIYTERKLLAGCITDHRRQPYREWRPLFMAQWANMKYRQVFNALRRLVPCGWVTHVRRGVYRITPMAVAELEWTNRPHWTQTKIKDAQVPGTEDKGT